MVLKGSKQKIQNPWPTFFGVSSNTKFWLSSDIICNLLHHTTMTFHSNKLFHRVHTYFNQTRAMKTLWNFLKCVCVCTVCQSRRHGIATTGGKFGEKCVTLGISSLWIVNPKNLSKKWKQWLKLMHLHENNSLDIFTLWLFQKCIKRLGKTCLSNWPHLGRPHFAYRNPFAHILGSNKQ